MQVVDLFCGAGGMALGLSWAGMRIKASYDFDPKALAVHQANLRSGGLLGLPGRRVRSHVEADLKDLLTLAPFIAELSPDVIVGGPPCQPFSSAGKELGDADDRARLTEAFGVMVATARPRYFVMENVPNIRHYKVYRRLMLMVRRAGYGITEIKLDASEYGSGQARVRLMCIGCLGEADDFLEGYLKAARSNRRTTVRDVLGADLDVQGIGPEGLFYMTPGGPSTAGTRSIDKPTPSFTHTSHHRCYSQYVPRKGDVPHVHRLPILDFTSLSRLAGFPETWNWSPERPAAETPTSGTQGRAWINKGDRMQMLANAVPPPLSEAVGRGLMAHARGEVPDVDPVIPQGYEPWLKRATKGEFSQALTDLKAAKRHYLGTRRFRNDGEALEFLERAPEFSSLGNSRKSNLRRAVRLFHQYEADVEEAKKRRQQKSRERTEMFDAQNWNPYEYED